MTQNIITALQNDDNKKTIVGFLNEIIKIDLKDITFNKIEKFQSIVEYDFYLTEFIGITKNNLKQEIFMKQIKKGKIKETLFCICDLFYEKYLRKDNYLIKNSKKPMKISIIETEEKSDKASKVYVNVFEKNTNKEKANMEIYFIKISEVAEQYKNRLKGWKKYIDLNQSGILVIGIKNKH